MSKNLCNKYNKWSEAELDAELRARGINPQRTIDAVLGLVRQKIREGLHRGLHHLCQGESWQWPFPVMVFSSSLAIGWKLGRKAA